eukprot:scaffold233462_cov19-Tisochrysis_lutea.AAC.1
MGLWHRSRGGCGALLGWNLWHTRSRGGAPSGRTPRQSGAFLRVWCATCSEKRMGGQALHD